MIPHELTYHAPAELPEVVDLLDRHNAQVLAGGQSLLPRMKVPVEHSRELVDIRRVQVLNRLEIDQQMVTIGAIVRQRTLEDSDELAQVLPIVREAARQVADPSVRSQGTIVGSMAAADPTGDWTAVALALNAFVTARSSTSERGIPLTDLLVGPHSTSLERNELLTQLQLETPPSPSGMAYVKLRHPASGYALVGVAAVVWLDTQGRCAGCRVAVTGAGPKASRLRATEQSLEGQALQPETLRKASVRSTENLDLSSDIHAGESYRSELVRVYARRCLTIAVDRAQRDANP